MQTAVDILFLELIFYTCPTLPSNYFLWNERSLNGKYVEYWLLLVGLSLWLLLGFESGFRFTICIRVINGQHVPP